MGLVNKETVPGYRIFVDQLDMQIQDLSNTFDRGIARVSLEGRFMGNGKLTTRAVIRPQNPLPDFDLTIKILKTKPMRSTMFSAPMPMPTFRPVPLPSSAK